MSVDWQRVIARALTGQDLAVTPGRMVDASRLERELAALGWDRARLTATADTAHAAGTPFPFPVPPALCPGVGPAQLAAAVREVRLTLGLLGSAPRSVSARTQPDADERRLLAEVPPHHL